MRLLVVFRDPPYPNALELLPGYLAVRLEFLQAFDGALGGHVKVVCHFPSRADVGVRCAAQELNKLLITNHGWPTSHYSPQLVALTKLWLTLSTKPSTSREPNTSYHLVTSIQLSRLGSTWPHMDSTGPRSDSAEKEWTAVTSSRPVRSDPRPRVTNGYHHELTPDNVRGAVAA